MTIAIPALTTTFLLVFARVGTLVMLLPGIGERTIPARLRLAFALLLSLALLPLLSGLFPQPIPTGRVIPIMLGELAVGFVLGLATRMVLAALQTAGTIVAQDLGLAFATTVDPTYGGQSASIANFLNLLGLTLIFALDIHHLAIAAIRDSYVQIPPVGLPDPGDAVQLAIGAVARGFSLGVRIAAPFVVFGIVFNLGLGVLSRFMPQLQVFFLGLPLSIILGILVLMASLGVMMGLFVTDLGQFLKGLDGL